MSDEIPSLRNKTHLGFLEDGTNSRPRDQSSRARLTPVLSGTSNRLPFRFGYRKDTLLRTLCIQAGFKSF